MGAARIVVASSALLTLLEPSTERWTESLLWKLLLRLIIAGVCVSYARTHGRGLLLWSAAAMLAPWFAPLILACLPDASGSLSSALQADAASPAGAEPAGGILEERFPLLFREIAGKPETVQAEQIQRFCRLPTNFEFLLRVDAEAAERISGEATTRGYSVWTTVEGTAGRMYGAGLVPPEAQTALVAWLRASNAPGCKFTLSTRQPSGSVKVEDYYPEQAVSAGN